jgi:hypothetical protein
MRIPTKGLLALLGLLAITAPCLAQVYPYPQVPVTPGPAAPPPVSPYINLRLGGNPAINYYGVVRPQVDARNAIQQLQTGFADTRTNLELEAALANVPVVTGNYATFYNHNRYFYTRSAQPGLGGYPGGVGTAGLLGRPPVSQASGLSQPSQPAGAAPPGGLSPPGGVRPMPIP